MKYLLILLLHSNDNLQLKNFKFNSKQDCVEVSTWITKNIDKYTVIENCTKQEANK